MVIGKDGRAYFKYSPGAILYFEPDAAAPFSYQILNAFYDDKTEKYLIQCDNREPQLKTEKDVDFLFSFLPYRIIKEGEAKELPLLDEEVERYFHAKKIGLEILNKQENEKLKGTGYSKLLATKSALQRELKLANADGNEDRAEGLRGKILETEESIAKLLTDCDVDKAILTKAPSCARCKDTGFVDGKICECALRRMDSIKVYNAGLRLDDKKGIVVDEKK